jgi:hypothetical protein
MFVAEHHSSVHHRNHVRMIACGKVVVHDQIWTTIRKAHGNFTCPIELSKSAGSEIPPAYSAIFIFEGVGDCNLYVKFRSGVKLYDAEHGETLLLIS